jgi:hypothetical protein
MVIESLMPSIVLNVAMSANLQIIVLDTRARIGVGYCMIGTRIRWTQWKY